MPYLPIHRGSPISLLSEFILSTYCVQALWGPWRTKQDAFLHIIRTQSNCQEGKCLTLGGYKLGHLKGSLPQNREKWAGIWRVSRINQVKNGKREETACAKALGWEGEWHGLRTWTLRFPGGEKLVHDECGQFLGPHGPHMCSLYPSSSGKPCKDLKHREWNDSIKPWSEQQEKTLHPHMRWEPIEIPTKKELSGQQWFQDFSLIMQNTQPSRGEVSFGKKSQQISFLICSKLLKCPVFLPLSPDGLWAILTFIREFFFN